MKCVEKYDASAKGARGKFWDMLIDYPQPLMNYKFS